MPWQPGASSLLAVIAAASSFALGGLAWRYRREPGALAFFGLMLAAGGWSGVYALQLGFTTGPEQLVWQRIGLALGGTIPTLWLLFAIRYAGRTEWLTRRRRLLLAVDPVVFGLLSLTNSSHGLLWRSASMAPGESFHVVSLAIAPGYVIHILYAYMLVIAGVVILLQVYFQSSTLYRKQTGLLVLGAIPPFIANLIFTIRLVWGSLPPLDLTPFAFTLTGVAFGLALFKFDLLERTPVARERMIEEMGDGLVVLDADREVVSMNSIARTVLQPGTSADGGITQYLDLDSSKDLSALDGTTVTSNHLGSERIYDVSVSNLSDHRGNTAGYVIALRDATDRHAYEQRLEVANRVLRHNLRNDMNVIHGLADQIKGETENQPAEYADLIVEIAEGLIDLSEKARVMVSTSDLMTTTPQPVEATEVIEEVLAWFRRDHPEIDFDYEPMEETWIALPDNELLRTALENLIENAIEHNETADPWVRISVRPSNPDDRVVIEVADNGPGIPAIEQDVLEKGAETPLEHGSGVGLWLVHWCVSAGGGEVRFSESDNGSVVSLIFQSADPPTD